MNYQEIFNQINKNRIEQGLSIASVCRKADTSVASWVAIRNANDKKGYNTKTLQSICKVLDVKEVTFKVD